MAGKTYPELTPAPDVVGTDLLATYRSGPLKRLLVSDFVDYVNTAITTDIEYVGTQQIALVTAAGVAQIEDIETAGANAISLAQGFYPGARSNVPQGIVSTASLVAGSGGTNGTFALSFSGGNFAANPSGTFTVSGGALTSVTITGPGLYVGASPTAPTAVLSASAGLTGASVVLTPGYLVTAGEYYWTDATDTDFWALFQNVADAATEVSPAETLPKNYGPFDGGTLGQIPSKASGADGDITYESRPDLSNQPTESLDLSSNSNRQLLVDNGLSNPTARATASVVGGKQRATLAIAANISLSCATSERPVLGQGYRAGMTVITNITPAQIGQWAVGLIFRGAAPAPGAAIANDTSGNPCLVLRYSSDVQALVFSAGTGGTAAPGVTITNELNPLAVDPLVPVEMFFTPTNATGTTGDAVWRQNGAIVASCSVSGLPANSYIGVVCRFAGAIGNVVEFEPLQTYSGSLDVPLVIYGDPTAGTGGTGTEADPYGTSDEILAAINADTARRTVKLILVGGGVWEDFSLSMPSWLRELHVEGSLDERTTLRGSVEIAASSANWTNISGNFWRTANPADAIGIGGLLQVGRSQDFGLNGLFTSPNSLYARQAPNFTYSDLLPGEMTAHFTGTYDGMLIVRCWDDDDPNDYAWRLATKSYVIGVAADGTGQMPILRLRNLDIEAAYSYGLQAEFAEMDVDGCNFRDIMVGNGLDAKDCCGTVKNGVSEANYADCVHANDSTLTGDDEDLPTLEFHNFHARGAFSYLLNGLSTSADAWSNHQGNQWRLYGCSGSSSGKDGISSSGLAKLYDFEAFDNTGTGVLLYTETGVTVTRTLDMIGGQSWGNSNGAQLTGSTLIAEVGRFNVIGAYFYDNVTTHLQVFGEAAADLAMTATNCSYTGTPSQGATKVSAGLTLTVKNGTAFV